MKILVTILSLLNGLYMLIDGTHVMIRKKYIGPQKPGIWAELFYKMKIDVFKLGPLFVAIGILWLIWIWGLWNNHSWAYWFGISASILTLWYIPFGAIFSLVTLIYLIVSK